MIEQDPNLKTKKLRIFLDKYINELRSSILYKSGAYDFKRTLYMYRWSYFILLNYIINLLNILLIFFEQILEII